MSENLYLKAIDVINQTGWCQKYWTRPSDGAHCLIGALEVAARAMDVRLQVIYTNGLDCTDDYAALDIPGMGMVSIWNDEPGRTQDEVIELLAAAAAKTEGYPW